MTVSREPTFGDYVKAAFLASPRIPLLGNLPLNLLAVGTFATLGLLHPGFWLVGAGIEVALVASLASHPRFRSHVRGRALAAQAAAQSASVERALEDRLRPLEQADRDRYYDLAARVAAAESEAARTDNVVAEAATRGLRSLQDVYLDLLLTLARLGPRVDPELEDKLQRELDAEERVLAHPDEPGDDPRVRRSREATVALLRQRIANLTSARRDVEYLRSELRRIEHQVDLIVDEASRVDDPTQVARRVDAVAATFDDTREWMRKHREILAEVEADVARPSRPPPSATRTPAGS